MGDWSKPIANTTERVTYDKKNRTIRKSYRTWA